MSGVLEQLLDEVRALRAEVAALRDQRSGRADMITIADYARARSISVSTVRAAIREGRLRSTHVGRAVRVPANLEIAPRPTESEPARSARAARVLGLVMGGG